MLHDKNKGCWIHMSLTVVYSWIYHLQEIFNSPLILPTDYRKLAELFTELCGEHYGSVTDVIPHRDTEGMEWQPDTPSTSTFSTASNNISHSPVQFDGIGGKVAVPISTGKELFAESPWFTSRKDSDVQDIAARMQNLDPQNAAYFRRLAISLNPASQPPQPTQEVRAADYLHAFKYYSLRCGTSPGRENVPMSGLFYWGSQLQRSCQPNVHMQWVWPDAQQREPGKLVFRAICDLRPGDHLLISSDVQGILYGRATRHQRLLDSSGRRCPCPLLTDQAISDGRREHIRNIVERVSYIRPTSDMIPDIETALNCIQEESVFHYRDTLWYALFLARDASENRNNAMLSRVLQHAIFWLKIMVGDSDTRTIDLEEHLQRICP
ncbi:hypothetical protein CPB86DRAFT_151778 [Serendipita vermifera]|nr:hypothetical protein CPB86DRAFT_151778 [Serendipita vermifera]